MVMMVARAVVLLALVYAGMVAATHWAVRRKHLNPFGPWAKFMRRASDPLLLPMERRLVLAGRNPQDAPLWMLGGVVVGGLIFLSVAGWGVGAVSRLGGLVASGPRGWAVMVINLGYTVLMVALIMRVIGSWFGLGRFRSWMQPAYVLTDWMLDPIRRVVPATGMIDFSPLIAWVLLIVLRQVLVGFFV